MPTAEDFRPSANSPLRAASPLSAPELRRARDVLSKPGAVDALLDLFKNRRLDGLRVLTMPAVPSPPGTPQFSFEPEARANALLTATTLSGKAPAFVEPSPGVVVRGEVLWPDVDLSFDTPDRALAQGSQLSDLERLVGAGFVYLLRWAGEDHVVTSVSEAGPDAWHIALATPAAAPGDKGSTIIHNGATRIQVSLRARFGNAVRAGTVPEASAVKRAAEGQPVTPRFSCVTEEGAYSVLIVSSSPTGSHEWRDQVVVAVRPPAAPRLADVRATTELGDFEPLDAKRMTSTERRAHADIRFEPCGAGQAAVVGAYVVVAGKREHDAHWIPLSVEAYLWQIGEDDRRPRTFAMNLGVAPASVAYDVDLQFVDELGRPCGVVRVEIEPSTTPTVLVSEKLITDFGRMIQGAVVPLEVDFTPYVDLIDTEIQDVLAQVESATLASASTGGITTTS